ncbi:MAG: T9SS type A sorting domain-containing protein, partial [Saprospiraceae bacterium]
EIKDNTSIEVFPQPAKERLNIRMKINKNVPNGQLQVIDLMGRTIHSMAIDLRSGQNDFTIEEINTLSAGYYILKVQDTELDLTKSLFIAR